MTTDTEEFVITEVPPDESPFRNIPPQFEEERPTTKSKPDTVLILKSLEKFYFSAGVMIRIVDMRDGLLICTSADTLAESWRTVLDNDPKLRRMMKNFIKSSGWGSVVTAHLMVALPIMENHGYNFSHLFRSKRKTEGEVFDNENV
jgi:hypothetical protein